MEQIKAQRRAREGTDFLNTPQASAFLGLSEATLCKWRVRGTGPGFVKFGGSVRYSLAALNRWADEQRRTSTSDRHAA